MGYSMKCARKGCPHPQFLNVSDMRPLCNGCSLQLNQGLLAKCESCGDFDAYREISSFDVRLSCDPKEKDSGFFPGGRDLFLKYHGIVHRNTMPSGETSGGSETASHSLARSIGLRVAESMKSAAAIKWELDKLDGDGNPGGLSSFVTQLQDCWIQHPAVNSGKDTKLIDYYLRRNEIIETGKLEGEEIEDIPQGKICVDCYQRSKG